MALLSGFDQLDTANNTFADWLLKTNNIIELIRGDTVSGATSVMTANSLPGGSMTFGNATLFGQFTSNTMVVLNNGLFDGSDDNEFGNSTPGFANGDFGGLRGGNWDPNTNNITADTLYVVSNTTFTPQSVEVYVNSTYGLIVENFIEARHDVRFVGSGSNTNPDLQWDDANTVLSFNNDIRATFGGSSNAEPWGGTSQMEMFYTGGRMYSNTDVQDVRSTANLNLITDRYELRTETGGENMMTANLNGEVVLYWDNAARLTTNSYGVTVHGDAILEDDLVIFDGNKILMGGNTTYDGTEDLTTYKFQMFTDGSDSYIVADDRDLYIEVNEGFELTNIGRGTHYMTANAYGQDEVILYANGTKRLEVVDGSQGNNSVDGVEIFGEANTTTLRVRSDANFDNDTLNSNSVHWDASLEVWNYRDDVKATWGDGDDLEIYYTGTRGNVNTDILDIRGSTNTNIFTDDFEMRSDTGNELLMTANVNNGVELYHNNIKKVSSNTYGVEVYGQVLADNGFVTYNNQPIEMGGANYAAAHNFTIVTDGTDTTITETSNDLSVRVEDNFRVTDDTGTTSLIVANTSGEVTLYHNNNQKMQTNAYGVEITGEANTGTLRVREDAAFDGSTGLDSNNISWDASANTLYVRDDTPVVWGDGNDLTIKHDGSHSYITEANTGSLYIEATNLVARATDGSRYLEGIDGSHVIIYSPDDTAALLANNNQIHITDLANTNTLRVRSTSLFEDDIDIEGSTGNPTLTWDKSANTLNFDDNNYITLGTAADLQLYHNGTNSYIDDSGTGNLYIRSNDLNIAKYTGETMIRAIADGSVILYHDNSIKLTTTAIGVDIEGQANTDTLRVQSTALFEDDVFFDTASRNDAIHIDYSENRMLFANNIGLYFGHAHHECLHLFNDGVNAVIREEGSGNLEIQANNVLIEDTDATSMITAEAGNGVKLYYNGNQKFITTTIGIDVTGKVQGDSLQIDGNVDLGASSSDTISAIGEFDTALIPANATANVGSGASPWDWAYFNDINVANTATILNLEVTSLEANGVAFTGTGGDVTTTSATVIDSFEVGQTQGFKFFVHGEDLADSDSGYAVEINVIVTDNSDIFYTRYGEVESNMNDVTILPAVAANNTHIDLLATCGSASGTNIHRFKVLKIETRP